MLSLSKILPIAALAIGVLLAFPGLASARPGLGIATGFEAAAPGVILVDDDWWKERRRWRGPPPGRGWRRDYAPYGYWAPPPRVYYPPPRVYYAPPPRVWVPPPRYYYAPPPPPGIGLYFRF